jgi:hypothetical protein
MARYIHNGLAVRLALLAGFAAALAACASPNTDPPTTDPNTFPTKYKQEILDTMAKTLDVPTNVKDALITDPVLRAVGRGEHYSVCVRYNARNFSNQYAGSKDRVAYFFGGHLNQLVDATPEQCGNAAYKPFPELEKLCYATACN